MKMPDNIIDLSHLLSVIQKYMPGLGAVGDFEDAKSIKEDKWILSQCCGHQPMFIGIDSNEWRCIGCGAEGNAFSLLRLYRKRMLKEAATSKKRF